MRFSLTRRSPGQSTSRIPPRQGRWRLAQALPMVHRPGPLAGAGTDPYGNTRSLLLHRRTPGWRPFAPAGYVVHAFTATNMASSDFRSAFHHFTGSPLIGFTSTRYRGLAPHGCVAWCRDGSLPFRDGLCGHSDPSTPTGSWVLRFQVLRTVHGLRYPCAELGSRFVLLAQVGGCDAAGFLIVRTDHSLAPQGDFVMALRRSDLSFRRPPATGLLGHYPGRTHTGKSITALSGHTTRFPPQSW
jgi:hypothetical protein